MVHHDAMGLGRKLFLAISLSAVLSACSGGGAPAPPSATKTNTKVEQPGKFADGTPMKAIQERGKLVVGLPLEQPPFAYEDPNTGSLRGFDVEIARLIANGIFGANIEGKVEFIPLDERDLALALSQNKIDIALGRYEINVQRKRLVDFAGPYFLAYQGAYVSADTKVRAGVRITNLSELNGRSICTVRGSTNIDAVKAAIPQGIFQPEKNTVQECIADVSTGKAVALIAEHVDVKLADQGGRASLTQLTIGTSLGPEPYGIGVSQQKIDLRRFLNDRLAKIVDDNRWEDALQNTVPKSDDKPPPLERY